MPAIPAGIFIYLASAWSEALVPLTKNKKINAATKRPMADERVTPTNSMMGIKSDPKPAPNAIERVTMIW